MNLASFALVLAGVLLNAFAQLLLKAGANRLGDVHFSLANALELGWRVMTIWPFLLGFAFYGISVFVWIAALTRVPVTVAYPMLSIGYVINAFVAWQWFGEPLSAQKLLGIGFIVLGVWLVAKS